MGDSDADDVARYTERTALRVPMPSDGAFVVEVARIPGCWVLSVPRLPDVVEYVERLDGADTRAQGLIAAVLGVDPAAVRVELRLSANPPAVLAGRPAPLLSQDALDPSPY